MEENTKIESQQGAILADMIARTGKTRGRFAAEAGVSRQQINHLVNGHKEMRFCRYDTISRIAKALGYSVDGLIDRVENTENPYRKAQLEDGWNTLPGIDVWVENGKVMRGIENDVAVYPYRRDWRQMVQVTGIPIQEFLDLADEGRIDWK